MASNRITENEPSNLAGNMSTQKEVIEALRKPEAYDEKSGQIELKQTHISFIFLTKNFVYKVKKAVSYLFLDRERVREKFVTH